MDATRPLEVEVVFPVRGYDIDFAGVVSNIVYIRWLEDLRTTILDSYLPLSTQMEQKYCPVVLHTQIHYKQAIRLFDQPVGRMWISKLNRWKWFVTGEISIGNKLAAVAEQNGCFVSLETWKPIRVPTAFANLVAAAQSSEDKSPVESF